MPLVVPILRLSMLFLNIYETFKTLRPPPPSRRNGGQPSIRALSQRKRDMKGCLAVWIVWCCFTTYERLGEAIVSLFVPFYNEIKSLVILFLILTRARGAEPIYLHVIRPLLKPYTETLDAALELVCMFGDIIFLLLTFPLRLAYSWWHNMFSRNDEAHDVQTNITHVASRAPSSIQQGERQVSREMHRPEQEARPSSEEMVHTVQQTIPDAIDRTSSQSRNPIALSQPPHQIWHPPPAAYNDDDNDDEQPAPNATEGEPQNALSNGSSTSLPSDSAPPVLGEVEEWRLYPAFPSAYPPTPLVVTSQLSSVSGAGASQRFSQVTNFAPILEDVSQQDFEQSLLPPRKPLYPSFVGDSSDNYHDPGVQANSGTADLSMAVDESDDGSDMDEQEDDFDITLQTPLQPPGILAPRLFIRPNSMASVASSGASSPSQLTALTTVDNESSSRTRESTESSSSSTSSVSDDPSLLGKKRSFSKSKVGGTRRRSRLLDGIPIQDASRRRKAVRTSVRRGSSARSSKEVIIGVAVQEDSETNSNDDDLGEDDSLNDRRMPEMKKRRVVMTPPRGISATRPLRANRVVRHVSIPPTKTQQQKPLGPPSAPARKSSRLHEPAVRSDIAPPEGITKTGSSSASDYVPPPRRFSKRNTRK